MHSMHSTCIYLLVRHQVFCKALVANAVRRSFGIFPNLLNLRLIVTGVGLDSFNIETKNLIRSDILL